MEDSNANQHNEWIVPAAFSPFPYINYPHYLEQDATLGLVREENRKTAIEKLVRNTVPENFSVFRQEEILVAKTVKNIRLGEELGVTCRLQKPEMESDVHHIAFGYSAWKSK